MTSQTTQGECLTSLKVRKYNTVWTKPLERAERKGSPVPYGDTARAGGGNVLHVLTSIRPKTRYLVRWDANRIAFLKWLLPDRGFNLRPGCRRFMMHKRRPDAPLDAQKTLLYLLLAGSRELP